MKKFVVLFFLFFIGLALAANVGDDLRQLIKGLLFNLSEEQIQFRENLYKSLMSVYFYITFALGVVAFCVSKFRMNPRAVILFVMLEIILFYLTLIAICYFVARAMLTACTACDKEVMLIYDTKINFEVIILSSLCAAFMPSVVYQIVRWRRQKAIVGSSTNVHVDRSL